MVRPIYRGLMTAEVCMEVVGYVLLLCVSRFARVVL